ncbi:MAG: hypothetical protein MUP47_04380 [Phycisphaerae bacterium]|nr:hypothetical protein [Phycisphaerae bacterium]
MWDQDGPYGWVGSLVRVWAYVAEACLAAALIATVILATAAISANPRMVVVAPYLIAVALETAAMVWVPVVAGVVLTLLETHQIVTDVSGRLSRVETLVDEAAESLKSIASLSSLSDKAKSTIYREHELEALRETIHHHLMLQDYDAASTLINSMERDFGYGEEARRLREEVAASRKATVEEKVDGSLRRFQEILDRHDWARATREAERMMRLMPNNPRIAQLPAGIQTARVAHKRQLLQEYGEAIRKNDVDRGIELLRQLDLYLTPPEAAALQESARGVFRAKLQNLNLQFTMSVTDQRWADAVATGEQIIRDFPNSRMAMEVREKMNLLHARAAAASGTAPTPNNA